jgi:hypothetical protein
MHQSTHSPHLDTCSYSLQVSCRISIIRSNLMLEAINIWLSIKYLPDSEKGRDDDSELEELGVHGWLWVLFRNMETRVLKWWVTKIRGPQTQWKPGHGWASQIEGYWVIWWGSICFDLVRIPQYLVSWVGNAQSKLGQLYCYNVQICLNTNLMCVFQAFMTLSSIIGHTSIYIITM